MKEEVKLTNKQKLLEEKMAADRLEGAKLSAQKVKKELKLANRAGNSVFFGSEPRIYSFFWLP